jgi:thiamine biosynthesis protein ThiS
VQIVLNGQPQDIPSGLTLLDLLTRLRIDPEKVAVELNRDIIRRAQWNSRKVEEGASIEVVQFVGGG